MGTGTLLAGQHRPGILMMVVVVLTKTVADGWLKMKKRTGEAHMATCYTGRACNTGKGIGSVVGDMCSAMGWEEEEEGVVGQVWALHG